MPDDDRDPMELQPVALGDVAGNPLTPSTLGQAMQLANMLAKSTLVPEAMQGKPVNVLMALMKGAEVGMTPVQTLSSVFVVDGKAEFYGKGMLAIVMQHPDYYDRKEWFTDNEGNIVERQAHCAHCVMYRVRRDGSLTQFGGHFSLEEAHQGKLQDKRNWVKSPDRMLMWRARAIAADGGFPDALRGLSPRPNQSAADFAEVDLYPPIREALESHGIKPPQADEPLTITCNCIDGAGFAQHDCSVCEGSGKYIDPRTDGSAVQHYVAPTPGGLTDPSTPGADALAIPVVLDPKNNTPLHVAAADEPPSLPAFIDTPCGPVSLGDPAEGEPRGPRVPPCPICNKPTDRTLPLPNGRFQALTCDECNARAAKDKS